MQYDTIDYSIDDAILTITLNRPDQLNAFTTKMTDELIDAFSRASGDDTVDAVIVTGAGRAFCAGMDLAVGGNVFGLDESMSPTLTDLRDGVDEPAIRTGVRDTGGRVTLAIYECTKPVIAAINGVAVGVGATMTLAMDARIASTDARIGFVFGKIGVVAESCSTWFLPRIVGMAQALDWAYSAEIMTAEQAKDGGLIRAIYPANELLEAANALARRFTQARSQVATALIRQMMYRNSAAPHPAEAHLIESLAMFYTSQGDGKEGVAAFIEKRAAHFTSRVSADMPPFYPWQ